MQQQEPVKDLRSGTNSVEQGSFYRQVVSRALAPTAQEDARAELLKFSDEALDAADPLRKKPRLEYGKTMYADRQPAAAILDPTTIEQEEESAKAIRSDLGAYQRHKNHRN